MEHFLKLFQRRHNRVVPPVNTNARVSKQDLGNDAGVDYEWEIELQSQKSLLSPLGKMKSLFSSKESIMSSQESLADISMTSGVAYRRHPDDKKSLFGRPNSTSTSVACYGRYSALFHSDVIDELEESLADEHTRAISISLYSLERIESIQKKSFEISKNRRKYLKNKENKKRRRVDDDLGGHIRNCQSMIELPLTAETTNEIRATPIVTRKTSIQRKSWEIRRQRNMKMKKRRSERYHGDCHPLLENSMDI